MPAGLLPVIYLAFIALGLPDSAIGSAWPAMAPALGAGLSWVGLVSMIISAGTIASSLMSVRVVERFGTGRVTAASVLLTALALVGFSVAGEFWQLCLLAVPYGLGAGAVDAALNAYVAVHYESQHMSWLHCMWGVGASGGPMIMGACLGAGVWNDGFRLLGIIQLVIVAVLTLSLPLWRDRKLPKPAAHDGAGGKPVRRTRRELLRIDGVVAVLICFFCYCSVEGTCGNWAASYSSLAAGVSTQTAASWASMFYIGITIGRGVSGFLSLKLSDEQMIRLGQAIIALGVLTMLSPWGHGVLAPALVLVGLGCAPIYPSIIHATPKRFGADVALELTGMQMAIAYVGYLVSSPLFGVLAQFITIELYPVYLGFFLIIMIVAAEKVNRIQRAR